VKGVGETVGDDHSGVEVVEIEREKVVLRYREELITLVIKPSAVVSNSAADPNAGAEARGRDDLKSEDESTAMDESTTVVGSTAVEK
jgi:hypothetical protein